jgi:RNA 2',3'-cyclic 3'-phosphodiesterase
MRCFLAIELSEAARQHLASVQEAMKGVLPEASYPGPENLHITLRFIGEADARQVEQLLESMQHVKVSGSPVLSAARMVYFPPKGPVRVTAASMVGSEQVVAALHQAVEQRCRKIGFEAEQRRYHPHVTLSRVRRGLPPAEARRAGESAMQMWPGPVFEVGQFVLFSSQLHSAVPGTRRLQTLLSPPNRARGKKTGIPLDRLPKSL